VAASGTSPIETLAAVTGRAPAGLLRERYRKDVVRLESEVARGEKKLSDQQFIGRAAPEVVAKEREKLEKYRSELARTRASLAALEEAS
jgi:valyl-tRNA synthetase